MSSVLLIGRTSDSEVTNTWDEITPDTTNGDSFPNDALTILIVRNSDNADHTVTFTTYAPDSVGDLDHPVVGTEVYTIPAGDVAALGPFNSDKYAAAGSSSITFKASDTTVKVSALSLEGFPNDPCGMRG